MNADDSFSIRNDASGVFGLPVFYNAIEHQATRQ